MLPNNLRPPYRAAGDRVYHAIKARLTAFEFPQGRRIYLEPIADSLGVSTTPVREAMNRLAERYLVVKAANKGYYAMSLTEARVCGYYKLTHTLLVLGLENLPPGAAERMQHDAASAQIVARLNRRVIADVGTLARYTGDIFNALAAISENEASQRAVNLANDHLYFARTIECGYVDDVQAELRHFCELLLSGQRGKLAAALEAYHEHRLSLLPKLLRNVSQEI